MSKGSKRRPCLVDRKQYESEYDRIFGRKERSGESERKKDSPTDHGTLTP